MYFAHVAPPKPPPMTTTRAPGPALIPAHAARVPVAASAPPDFRKSRRVTFMAGSRSVLQRRKVGCERVDFRVGIALGDLMHDRGGALARLELLHLLDDVRLGHPESDGIPPWLRPSVPWQFAQFDASSRV
jgi:hypothetical protein